MSNDTREALNLLKPLLAECYKYLDKTEADQAWMLGYCVIPQLEDAIAALAALDAPATTQAQVDVCSDECRRYLEQEGECPACEIKEHRAKAQPTQGREVELREALEAFFAEWDKMRPDEAVLTGLVCRLKASTPKPVEAPADEGKKAFVGMVTDFAEDCRDLRERANNFVAGVEAPAQTGSECDCGGKGWTIGPDEDGTPDRIPCPIHAPKPEATTDSLQICQRCGKHLTDLDCNFKKISRTPAPKEQRP